MSNPEGILIDKSLLRHSRELASLRSLLDSIAHAQGIGVGLFTPDCERFSGSSIHSAFCRLIRESTKDGVRQGAQACETCDREHFPSDGKSKGPYLCHAGLLDFSVPLLTSKGSLAGAIFGGQVLDHPLTKGDFARFRELAGKYGIEEVELYEAATKLKQVTAIELHALVALAETIAKTSAELLEQNAFDLNFIHQLSNGLDLNQLSDQVVLYVHTVTGAAACSIFINNEDHDPDSFILVATSSTFLKPLIGKATYKRGEGLTGWVCQHGKPLLIPNIQSPAEIGNIKPPAFWKAVHVETSSKTEVGSFLAVPLLSDTGGGIRTIGVIRAIRSKGSAAFPERDLITVNGLARYIVNAIESVQNHTHANSYANALQTISESSRLLNTTPDPSELFTKLIINGLGLIREDSGHVSLYVMEHVPDRGKFVLTHGGGTGFNVDLIGATFPDADGLAGRVLRTRSHYLSNDLTADPYYKAIGKGVISALVVPIWRDSVLIGVVSVGSDQRNAFKQRDVSRFASFAELFGVAFQKALWNRRDRCQIAVLNGSMDAIMDGDELPVLGERILSVVAKEFKANASLFLPRVDGNLYLACSTDQMLHERAKKVKVRCEFGQGLTGRIAQERHSIRLGVSAEAQTERRESTPERNNVGLCCHYVDATSYLGVPIVFRGRPRSGEKVWGVLELWRTGASICFSREDEEVALSIADYAAIALTFGDAYSGKEMAMRGFAHDAGGPIQTLANDTETWPMLSSSDRDACLVRIGRHLEYFGYLLDTYIVIGQRKHVHLSIEEFQVKPLVDKILWMAMRSFGEKDSRIEPINNVPAGLTINADKAKFYIMIYNLTVNAIRACDQLVRVDYVSRVAAHEFLVVDDGPGVDLQTVWGAANTGHLGLLIVRVFAMAHKGDLYYAERAEEGKGTMAVVWLPKERQAF